MESVRLSVEEGKAVSEARSKNWEAAMQVAESNKDVMEDGC